MSKKSKMKREERYKMQSKKIQEAAEKVVGYALPGMGNRNVGTGSIQVYPSFGSSWFSAMNAATEAAQKEREERANTFGYDEYGAKIYFQTNPEYYGYTIIGGMEYLIGQDSYSSGIDYTVYKKLDDGTFWIMNEMNDSSIENLFEATPESFKEALTNEINIKTGKILADLDELYGTMSSHKMKHDADVDDDLFTSMLEGSRD